MAAGTPAPAVGKTPPASLRPETQAASTPSSAQANKAGRDPSRLATKDALARREDAAAAREAAWNATDRAQAQAQAQSRAQARAQGGTGAAGRRSAFSAALDKARAPAQPQADARAWPGTCQAPAATAPNPTTATAAAANAGAEAAAAGFDALAQLAGIDANTQASGDAAPDEPKSKADGGPAGDPLGEASAAVASLLGWLQPVLPTPGQQSGSGAAGHEGGDAQDAGGGIDALGATAAATAAGAASGAGTGAQHAALQAMGGAGGPAPGASSAGQAGAASADATAAAGPGDALAGRTADAQASAAAGTLAGGARDSQAKPARVATGVGPAGQAGGFDASQSLRASAAALAPPVERSVPAPMGDRHWARALSTQVLLLANHRIESATLRLSPEHTGPVEVRIQLQDSAINLAFNATQADTRAALEQALPQLRAAFAGAGLALGQATVGQQMRQGSQFSQGSPNGTGLSADHPEATAAIVRPLGLLDAYA